MQITKRFTAIFIILMFAGNLLSILPLANATVEGALTIVAPDKVAAGGPVQVDATGMTATGGTIYFYLSLNDDPEISSGDIYFASAKTEDAIVDIQTLFITASVSAGDYYVKGVDIKGVGRACVVSDNTIEIIDEGMPTVEIDDTTGHVGDAPEITISDAGDWDAVTVTWKTFEGYAGNSPYALVDGEVTVDDWEVPDAYKGTYKILVFFDGDDTYATYLEFSITPDLTSDFLSIPADEIGTEFTITGTGFPEGTVDANSITLLLKNFMTGSTIDNYETIHDETDIGDGDVLAEGQLVVDVMVDAVEAGVLDITIPVDSTSTTFAAAFYSSAPNDDFTTITHYKISGVSGQNEDDVTFSFINLPADAAITINWIGSTVTVNVVAGASDANGAFKDTWEIVDLPGGEYSVRASVDNGVVVRERTIATFTVLPKFTVAEDDAVVGAGIDLEGSGFPADAVLDTVKIGGADGIDIDVNVAATGYFLLEDVIVPEVSGGGLAVTVKVSGEDADGVAISAQDTVIIKSQMILDDSSALEFDGEDYSQWVLFGDGPLVFPGHVLKLIGNGYLAGETLTVNLYDDADKLVGAAVVGDGGKADADGNVELVAWLPNAKVLYPAGKLDCYLKVAGSTATNKDNTDPFDINASDDGLAFILNGIANDGDADTDVKVGETLRVVGFGFRTKTLTLTANGDDIKTVSSVNGYFDTSFTIPELQGWWDGGEHYDVEVDIEAAPYAGFDVFPMVVLSPVTGFVDSKFTVSGTGFEDDVDYDISWVGIIGDEVLDTVDGADVVDGSFAIEVTVPAVVPQAYKVEVVDGDDVWKSAVYTVADKAAVDQAAKLDAIIAQLNGVDFAGLKTQVAAAEAAATAAQTSATAAQTTAAAAKTSADAAKTAADAVGVTANAAKTAADSAKTAADSAKAAADSAKAAADAGGVKTSEINSKVDGLQTLIYGAIGASLIAAIAAIVALMQISRKIA
jgi:hypothetical protein